MVAIWSTELQLEGSNGGALIAKGLIPVPEELKQKLVTLAFCWARGDWWKAAAAAGIWRQWMVFWWCCLFGVGFFFLLVLRCAIHLHFIYSLLTQAGRNNPNVTLSVTDITADKVTIRELLPPQEILHMLDETIRTLFHILIAN